MWIIRNTNNVGRKAGFEELGYRKKTSARKEQSVPEDWS
jgi:hypothetical protein